VQIVQGCFPGNVTGRLKTRTGDEQVAQAGKELVEPGLASKNWEPFCFACIAFGTVGTSFAAVMELDPSVQGNVLVRCYPRQSGGSCSGTASCLYGCKES